MQGTSQITLTTTLAANETVTWTHKLFQKSVVSTEVTQPSSADVTTSTKGIIKSDEILNNF